MMSPADDKLDCANRECRWRKGGRCVLFPGVASLECKHRIPPRQQKPTTTNKKG